MTEMLELADKNFTTACNYGNNIMGNMLIMNEKMEKSHMVNKNYKNQVEILKWKNTIANIKISLMGSTME